MASIIGSPKLQFFKTGTSDFLAGGKVYTYKSGTMIAKATYPTTADAGTSTNANTNPVILDSRGEASIVCTSATRLIVKDSADNVVWTLDEVGIGERADNDAFKFVYTPNAVNRVLITNAATSNPPIIGATGADTNIGLSVSSKGSGTLKLDGGATGTVDIGLTSTGAINLRRAVTAHITLDVTGNATVGGTLGVTGAATAGALTCSGVVSGVPLGSVAFYCGSTVPTSWLECDGTAVSRTTYATLFALVGTLYGSGDGTTTFNLPNLSRRTLVGRGGSGTATLANTVGATGGEEAHVLTTSEIPSHLHTHGRQTLTSTGVYSAGVTMAVNTTTLSTSTVGSSTAHNTYQPSLVLMSIIRAF